MASTYSRQQPQPQQPPSASASVPATPHNQTKTKAGPVPDLISALREDNRSLVTDLLRLDPTTIATSPSTSDHKTSDADAKLPPVSWRQRLVFSTDSLRNLFLRNILSDPANVNKVAAKKKKQPKSKQRGGNNGGADDDADLPIPRGLGIVGTRVLSSELTPDGTGDGAAGGAGGPQQVHLVDSSGHGSSGHGGGGAAGAEGAFAESGSDPRDATDGADVVVYFLRPDARQARSVCRRIKQYAFGGDGKIQRHRVVFVPNPSALTDKILLDEGVLPMDSVSVHSLPVDLVPLDADVLSLERAEVLRTAHVEGVPSDPVATVARSLVTLQDVTGTIPRVQCLGPMAEAVLEKMMSVRMDDWASAGEGGGGDAAAGSGAVGEGGYGGADGGAGIGPTDGDGVRRPALVDAMMIIDRKVDMVTPMLTPLTYEGLLDEVLGIDCGLVRVDADVVEPPEEEDRQPPTSTGGESQAAAAVDNKKLVALPLNDADTLYAEVRDQHVEKFGHFLKSQAKALKETHSDFTNKDRDLSEIHQFVKQIPIFTQNLRSLTHHILLAELVKGATEESEFRQRWQTERSMVESEACYETLEDLIACQEPPYRLLRLLCLQSLTGGGIKSSKFDSLRREVVQTYGYEFVFILNNLEKAGLLRRRETQFLLDSASPFATLRKLLRLINAEVNTADPDDVSYVSSGYAPLTARLVEIAATIGWAGKDEALRELPGRLVDVVQRDPPEDLEAAMQRRVGQSLGAMAREIERRNKGGGKDNSSKKKPVLLVYFVGGVTFMEVAALRFLSKRPSFPYSIVICTTKIVSGRTLLKSLS